MTTHQRQIMKKQIEDITDTLHDAQEALIDIPLQEGTRGVMLRALDNLRSCDTILVSLMQNVLGERV